MDKKLTIIAIVKGSQTISCIPLGIGAEQFYVNPQDADDVSR